MLKIKDALALDLSEGLKVQLRRYSSDDFLAEVNGEGKIVVVPNTEHNRSLLELGNK